MAIFVQINAMARQNDMGREGESEARAYLVKHGYNVLHTNWHWHHYELDIIAVKEDELIVVEVKTRSEDFLLSPEDAVDIKKIRRIVAAADAYVRYRDIDQERDGFPDRPYRRCFLCSLPLKDKSYEYRRST